MEGREVIVDLDDIVLNGKEKKVNTHPDDIELNDQENIQNILGNPPGWILNWGITLILFSVIVLLGISYFIKYPDKMDVRVKITTENPPVRIVSKMSGKLTELKVADKEDVKEGTILGIMENTAVFKDVERLESKLDRFNDNPQYLHYLQLPKSLELGNLQNSYSTLITKLDDLKYHKTEDITTEKVIRLREQIKQTGLLNNSLKRQKETLGEEGKLVFQNYLRYQELFKEGGTSKVELEQKESAWLQHQRQIESMETNMINNKIQIQQLETQIMEIGKNTNDQFSSKELAILDDLKKLREAVKEWKHNYLIVAPIAGKISMPIPISSNQHINASEEILTIIPNEENNELKVEGILPMTNSGKVKNGLKANILVDGFPQQEYGTLPSFIENISLVPQKGKEGNVYLLELALTDSLNTSYNKSIVFRQEMEGTASIFTNDKRILDRIFEQLVSLVKS